MGEESSGDNRQSDGRSLNEESESRENIMFSAIHDALKDKSCILCGYVWIQDGDENWKVRYNENRARGSGRAGQYFCEKCFEEAKNK